MLLSVEIGRNIVSLRKARKITQEQLALQSDMSVSRLRDIEHGYANTTIDTLESLARTLSVPMPVLLILSYETDDLLSMHHEAKAILELQTQETVV